MQLCAFDQNRNIVSAYRAAKHLDYCCWECGGIVRLRSGLHRQKHFYHLSPPKECRQSGKSMEHLQVQEYLKRAIGDGCALEHPFPSIGRIADCAWHSERVVFEVQCSPIAQKEVVQRNSDYSAAGWHVVWILHDKQFNQRRVSAAELWLRDHPHYYTNVDKEGKGHIYDQVDLLVRGQRRRLLKPVIVVASRLREGVLLPFSWPMHLGRRQQKWGLQGDWADLVRTDPCYRTIAEDIFKEAFPKEKASAAAILKRNWDKVVARPYRILFDYLLEKACR